MNPIEALELELVAAAERRRHTRRRPPARTLLLAAALALVLAAVPAWATGLLDDVFHQGAPPRFGPGVPAIKGQRDYVVARGATARGEAWRIAIEKNGPLQQKPTGPNHLPRSKFDCWALTIGPPPQGGGGECAYTGLAHGRGIVALDGITTGRVSRRDHRGLVQLTTLGQDDRLAVTLRSGKRFFVRPMQIDQAKLARTGLHFPFGIVVFTIPRGDRLRGIELLDASGRSTGSFMLPKHVPASAPTVQSPAF